LFPRPATANLTPTHACLQVKSFGSVISESDALLMIRRSYEEAPPANGLPKSSTDVLKVWFLANQQNPCAHCFQCGIDFAAATPTRRKRQC